MRAFTTITTLVAMSLALFLTATNAQTNGSVQPGTNVCGCPELASIKSSIEKLEKYMFVKSDKWQVYRHDGNSYAYRLFFDKSTYSDAKEKCARNGATLAAAGLRLPFVRNQVLTDIVKPARLRPWTGSQRALTPGDTWVGLDELENPGQWMWADGVQATSQNTDWSPGEPNNAGEKCGNIAAGFRFRMNDHNCGMRFYYLCEIVY